MYILYRNWGCKSSSQREVLGEEKREDMGLGADFDLDRKVA
jgi:hypothetical protein